LSDGRPIVKLRPLLVKPDASIDGIYPQFFTEGSITVELTGSYFGTKSDSKYIVMEDQFKKMKTMTIGSWSDNNIVAKAEKVPPGKYLIFINSYNGHRTDPIEIHVNERVESHLPFARSFQLDGLQMDVFDEMTSDDEPNDEEIDDEIPPNPFDDSYDDIPPNPFANGLDKTEIARQEIDPASGGMSRTLNKFCKAIDCISTIAQYVSTRRDQNDELGQLFDQFQAVFQRDVDKALAKRLKKLLDEQL